MKMLKTLSAATLLAAASMAQAQDSGSGCGLGAEVLKGQSGKGTHIAAAILNGLVIPNTTFMTTGGGLMGCDPTQTVKNEEAAEVFVASNMDQLSTEIARGGGEHLDVLAALMGVQEQDRVSFQAMAQLHYDQVFSMGADAGSVIASIETAMLTDDELARYARN